MTKHDEHMSLLFGARTYLSGPMDFVASRAREKKYGWRNRVSQFLSCYGVRVFDPWNKPSVKGFDAYGEEDVKSTGIRKQWTFEKGKKSAFKRAEVAAAFRETMRIDLRMVDISDFIIAYCPTNIYSVGTPHEIVVARQQHKPVLFVSPPIVFPAFDELCKRAKNDPKLKAIVEELRQEAPIKPNPQGNPSLWYITLVGSENFFDGFGFEDFRHQFKWQVGPLDERERKYPPKRPLLAYLHELSMGRYPMKWDRRTGSFKQNDDWLMMHHALESSTD